MILLVRLMGFYKGYFIYNVVSHILAIITAAIYLWYLHRKDKIEEEQKVKRWGEEHRDR